MCDDYNEDIANEDNPFRDPENYRNLFEFTRNLSLRERERNGAVMKTKEKNNMNKNGRKHFLKEEIQGGGIEKYPGPPNVVPSLHTNYNQMKTISTSQKSFRSRNCNRVVTEEPR